MPAKALNGLNVAVLLAAKCLGRLGMSAKYLSWGVTSHHVTTSHSTHNLRGMQGNVNDLVQPSAAVHIRLQHCVGRSRGFAYRRVACSDYTQRRIIRAASRPSW
jgi:hypothetical protein